MKQLPFKSTYSLAIRRSSVDSWSYFGLARAPLDSDPGGARKRPSCIARKKLQALAFLLILPFASGECYADAADGIIAQGSDSGDMSPIISSPQSVRAGVNTGGPENWPENLGISTTPGSNAPTQEPMPSTREAAAGAGASPENHTDAKNVSRPVLPPNGAAGQVSGEASKGQLGININTDNEPKQSEPAQREVIYVDEQGNPVDKPPEPEKMLEEARKLMSEGKFDEALPVLEQLRQQRGLSRQMQEDILYDISDCMWSRYADNPLAGYEAIISSTNEAMNANLRSKRVPEALLRLGLANAKVGNLTDAGGYIVALYRRYPDYPGVAQGFTTLGGEQLKKGRYAEAEQSFGVVLDKYPESPQLQEASVGLAYALENQKKYDKAHVILDFISKRWPRYYINDPDFLLLQAANDEKINRIGTALDLYWLYLNLDPKKAGNDGLMLKMADMYWDVGNRIAADFIYNDIRNSYPDTPSARKAEMRLAEQGIYDSPINYDTMRTVFARAPQSALWQIYNQLAQRSSTEPDGILAKLKLAMLLLWDKKYTESMGAAAEFIDDYPEDINVSEARSLVWQAFRQELEQSLAEKNYGRILILWNGFPLVRERYGEIDAPLRYALAQGWKERGDEKKMFELLGEFLKSPMDPQYGELAFSEFFNSYLEKGAWDKIIDLGKLVDGWPLKPQLRDQLDYALALSAQNLNLSAPALTMWRKLADRKDIPLYQQAYANYFLARDAENRRDIWGAYNANRKVIDMFTLLQDERSDKADPRRIKEATASLMDICEVGNRIPEALQWVERYREYLPEDSPEIPGLKFREARLRRKLGDNARSQALLEDIIRTYPGNPFAQAASGELRTFEVSRDLQNYLPSPMPADSQNLPAN